MKKIFKSIALLLVAAFPELGFGQWVQVGNSINGQAVNEYLATSTAISADGNIVALGIRSNADGGSGAGQVKVMGYTNNAWTQIGANINGESGGDQTGTSVSLSDDGSVLAIGESFNNDLGFTSGQVRVFRNINNSWSPLGQDLYGEHAVADAGRSVDLSSDGSILAFGAPNTTVNGSFFAGKVKVFENQNNTWVQRGADIEGDGAVIKFGQSVSLSDDGNIVAVGQTGDPINSNPTDTGRVKVYEFVNNQWVQLGNTIFGTMGRDEFGYQVSLSADGNILAIGTFGKGEVKVYELLNGVWTQIGNTLVGNSTGDLFGFSLSLTSDGNTLVVGARSINAGPGSAYIFENQGGNWVLVHDPILGVATGDQAGFSVSITRDGSRVVVSSIGNDQVASNAGHVRIFENAALSSNQAIEQEIVNIYPNPTNGMVTIEGLNTAIPVRIINALGELVAEVVVSPMDNRVDFNRFPGGVYYMVLEARALKIVRL
jgi:hypothetical protein